MIVTPQLHTKLGFITMEKANRLKYQLFKIKVCKTLSLNEQQIHPWNSSGHIMQCRVDVDSNTCTQLSCCWIRKTSFFLFTFFFFFFCNGILTTFALWWQHNRSEALKSEGGVRCVSYFFLALRLFTSWLTEVEKWRQEFRCCCLSAKEERKQYQKQADILRVSPHCFLSTVHPPTPNFTTAGETNCICYHCEREWQLLEMTCLV